MMDSEFSPEKAGVHAVHEAVTGQGHTASDIPLGCRWGEAERRARRAL